MPFHSVPWLNRSWRELGGGDMIIAAADKFLHLSLFYWQFIIIIIIIVITSIIIYPLTARVVGAPQMIL